MSWYEYARKEGHLHIIDILPTKVKRKDGQKITAISYDESFPFTLYITYIFKRKKAVSTFHIESKELIEAPTYNLKQKHLLKICLANNLISKEEYEHNENLIVVDDI